MNRPVSCRKWIAGLVTGALVALALPGSALANTAGDAYEPAWALRFYLAAIDFDESSPGGGGSVVGDTYGVDFGGGFGVSAEYRFARHLGIDLGAMSGAGIDLLARRREIGELTMMTYETVSFTPLTVGLDIHLTPDAPVDLYLCPMVAWTRYGGLAVATDRAGVTTTDVEFDDELGVGAAIGLSVPFGDRHWSFHTHLTYMDGSMKGTGREGVFVNTDYDMTILGVGLGYRF